MQQKSHLGTLLTASILAGATLSVLSPAEARAIDRIQASGALEAGAMSRMRSHSRSRPSRLSPAAMRSRFAARSPTA